MSILGSVAARLWAMAKRAIASAHGSGDIRAASALGLQARRRESDACTYAANRAADC